ncbi:hypothetical protein ANN_22076 [Periplaneta americana]|uniref:GIY-YIG domain-containing protein n=1 Tax=Periplaneta americana TaxID=6978 RepID=A0ABQ8S7I2_PERAM|nr:hypothetical protein ANN_22076 [Periplaneta americana]
MSKDYKTNPTWAGAAIYLRLDLCPAEVSTQPVVAIPAATRRKLLVTCWDSVEKRSCCARTGIADVLKRRGWEVYEEIHCVSSLDSNRRADIVAIHRTQSKGLVLDPTIRFERDALQAQHVDEEKKSIYESCIPYLMTSTEEETGVTRTGVQQAQQNKTSMQANGNSGHQMGAIPKRVKELRSKSRLTRRRVTKVGDSSGSSDEARGENKEFCILRHSHLQEVRWHTGSQSIQETDSYRSISQWTQPPPSGTETNGPVDSSTQDERDFGQRESPSEICHLRKTFLQNNFGNREIGLALRRAFSDKPPAEEQEETKGMTYIPFYGPISGKISRMLRKHGIKTIHKPPTMIQNLLRPVKDDLGLRTPGVYRIPCECGKCYIGQTGRTIMERCKEHQRSIRLYYPDKSAVAQHSLETGHKIDFSATTILDKTSGYWDLVIKEAIEIQLDGNNFNRDGGLQLSTAWKPAINTLRPPAHGRQSGPASGS